MAKTKPIGVRFDGELLLALKELGILTPQKALIFLENFYLETKNEPMPIKPTETPQIKPQVKSNGVVSKVVDMPKKQVVSLPDGRPERLEGEESLDYAARVNLWKQSKK